MWGYNFIKGCPPVGKKGEGGGWGRGRSGTTMPSGQPRTVLWSELCPSQSFCSHFAKSPGLAPLGNPSPCQGGLKELNGDPGGDMYLPTIFPISKQPPRPVISCSM